MDQTTASYYRGALFCDAHNTDKKIPPGLIRFHTAVYKRCTHMNIGGLIPKQLALMVTMLWLTNSEEGIEFAKTHCPDILQAMPPLARVEAAGKAFSWDDVAEDTPVIITDDNQEIPCFFISRRTGWIDVKLNNGDRKTVRVSQVRLA